MNWSERKGLSQQGGEGVGGTETPTGETRKIGGKCFRPDNPLRAIPACERSQKRKSRVI